MKLSSSASECLNSAKNIHQKEFSRVGEDGQIIRTEQAAPQQLAVLLDVLFSIRKKPQAVADLNVVNNFVYHRQLTIRRSN